MLDRADVEAVLNLTPITVHGTTSYQIVSAGKHLASEKPLASTLDEAEKIIETAGRNGATVVCSPPDMLYPVYQEARRLIDAGVIGKVAFARVRSSHEGPGDELWPGWPTDPTWFYQEGAGPLFDLGVYGIHRITGLLGPAKRVSAFGGITEPSRTVRGGPFAGTVMQVTTEDTYVFMLDFGGSTYAVVDGSFNVQAASGPKIEVFGTEGTINIHEPSAAVPLEIYRHDVVPGIDGWVSPRDWGYLEEERVHRLGRAILVDHLVDCVRSGTQPVLSAAHACHSLEIMLKVRESARTGCALQLTTTF
jgi:predicted dehydrogenase